MKRGIALLVVAWALTGCGQPGELYLPDEPAATVEPAPSTDAAPPAADDEHKKK